jgi:Tfp pilus assembly protein PilN
MKAVNLIPSDAPGGRSGGARTGVATYAVLGVLAVLLAGVTAFVLTGNDVAKRRDELATLQTQATAVQLQAERLHPYVQFATLAQARVETVRQLGAARFNWHRAFTDLSTVLPDNVWLTSLLGTVAPGVTVDGGTSGGTNSLRSSVPNPAIELTGCTTSHDDVVRLVSRLRLLHGVQRVSLADSMEEDSTAGSSGGGGSSGGSDGDCRHGHANFPQFDVVVFFAPLPTAQAPASAAATATTASAPAPAAAATPSTTTATTPTGSGAQ